MSERLFKNEPVEVNPADMFGCTCMILGRTRRTGRRYLLTVSILLPNGQELPAVRIHAAHCASNDGALYLSGPIVHAQAASGGRVLSAITLRPERGHAEFDAFLKNPTRPGRDTAHGERHSVYLADSDIDWWKFTSSFRRAYTPTTKYVTEKWPSRLTQSDLARMNAELREFGEQAKAHFREHPEELPKGAQPMLKKSGAVSESEQHKEFILDIWHFTAAIGLFSLEGPDEHANAYARAMEETAYPWRQFALEFGPRDVDDIVDVVAELGGLPPAALRQRLGSAHACTTEMLRYFEGERAAVHRAVRSFEHACTRTLPLYDPSHMPGELLFALRLLLAAMRPVLVRDKAFCCYTCLSLFVRPDGMSDHRWERKLYCSESCRKIQEERRREFRKDLAREFPEYADDPFGMNLMAIFVTLDDKDKERFVNVLDRVKKEPFPSSRDPARPSS